jgi:hypothetical protein
MTTPTTTPVENTIAASDPHLLRDGAEPLANELELRACGIGGTWLRRMRRKRRVRYIDLRPDLPPGQEARDRYLYAVSDVVRERTAAEQRAAMASAFPARLVASAAPRSSPPPPRTAPTTHTAGATHRGSAMPEVIVLARRAGVARS